MSQRIAHLKKAMTAPLKQCHVHLYRQVTLDHPDETSIKPPIAKASSVDAITHTTYFDGSLYERIVQVYLTVCGPSKLTVVCASLSLRKYIVTSVAGFIEELRH
nr:unnamed protein product [Callosobruchus analis]